MISKYRTKETGLSLRENMIINPAKDKKITIEEVIEHDFESMRQKEYIREML